MENLCRLVGFNERQTATLVSGKPLVYAGELYSEEHKRRFTTQKIGFQVVQGAIREISAEHTQNHITAKEKQGDKAMAVYFTEKQ